MGELWGFLIRFAAERERRKEEGRRGGFDSVYQAKQFGLPNRDKGAVSSDYRNGLSFGFISISRILEFVEGWVGFENTRSWNCPWKEGREKGLRFS